MNKRSKLLQTRIETFIKQVGRKADKNASDSNDRAYDRKLERQFKRMKPADLDQILNGPEDEKSE